MGITSGDGRCCSEKKVASWNVKGVFLADGSAKGLRRFSTHPKKTHLVIQNVGSRLGVLGNRREMSSLCHVEEAEVGIWSSKAMLRCKHLSRTLTHKWLLTGGEGLKGSAYGLRPIRKDLGVMSQWAHSPWTWRVLRQLLPVLLLWLPSQPRGERQVPLYGEEDFSVKCGIGKWEGGRTGYQ
jgi:hypothetical protein